MKSASTASGEIDAAGFPFRKGSITSLCPPVSSPSAACPYQVNFVVIRAPLLYSIGKIKTESIAITVCHTCPGCMYDITRMIVGNLDKKTYNQLNLALRSPYESHIFPT